MSQKTILYADPMPEWTQKPLLFELLPLGFTLRYVDAHDQATVSELLRECDYCITGWAAGKIDDAFLRKAPKLRFIQIMGAGYENVMIEDVKARGVIVANTSGVNACAVAEHVVMFLLAHLKKLVYAHTQLMCGNWAYAELQAMGIEELQGKTVGIIGYGRIGREIVKRLHAFDVRLLYTDVTRNAQDENKYGLTYCQMDDLLRTADAVVLQVPLTDETYHLISHRELDLMKNDALLINTARGQVVCHEALVCALENGKIGGACLDCFDQEPLPAESRLLRCQDILMTPHIAGASRPVFGRSIQLGYDNILRVEKGIAPVNQITT